MTQHTHRPSLAQEAAAIAERDDLCCPTCGARVIGSRAGGGKRTYHFVFYCPVAEAEVSYDPATGYHRAPDARHEARWRWPHDYLLGLQCDDHTLAERTKKAETFVRELRTTGVPDVDRWLRAEGKL
jgi:hypothetical protein